MKTMFCPKCGAGAQSVESYCTLCGEWLPDMGALARRQLFRRLTRGEKIAKVRVLEMVSAGLSLTSAVIIIDILAGTGDPQMLPLVAFCCLLVAAYQMVNVYLGYKVRRSVDQSRAEGVREMEAEGGTGTRTIGGGDGRRLAGAPGGVEHATELLEPVPRAPGRDE